MESLDVPEGKKRGLWRELIQESGVAPWLQRLPWQGRRLIDVSRRSRLRPNGGDAEGELRM